MDSAAVSLLRLDIETRSHHAAADSGWRALLGSTVTKWEYIRRLVNVYGFEAPLEAALAYTPNLKILIDLRSRFRSGWIAQDLLSLGLSASEIAALPQCFPMAPFGSPLEALGWLYVMERSTLVHDAIRSNVIAHVPDARRAVSYLSAYEGIVSSRWQELGVTLDKVVRSPRMLDDVIAAAHAGFRCLANWSRDDQVQARGA